MGEDAVWSKERRSRVLTDDEKTFDCDDVSNFMDDIIIGTDTWDRHIEVLTQVLTQIERAGLKAKPTKCYFGYQSLSFLGHEIQV